MPTELRKSLILDDRYVIIAKERAKRPHDFKKKREEKLKKHSKIIREAGKNTCFFCAGNEESTPPEISRISGGKNSSWIIRNFPNKFPATPWHEIIVETPLHGKGLGDLSTERIEKVLEVYNNRTKKILKESKGKVKYVLVFKNRGEIAGASLAHSHTQVIGTSIIPPVVQKEVIAVKKYYKKNKSCKYCDMLKKESKTKRLVFSDRNVVVYTPYASRFPFEVWLLPKRHIKSLDEMTKKELKSFAYALKKILYHLNKTLGRPPYNYYLHVSPKGEDLHFHLELFPRFTKLAGFEFGSGIIINIMPPEIAADYYRKGF